MAKGHICDTCAVGRPGNPLRYAACNACLGWADPVAWREAWETMRREDRRRTETAGADMPFEIAKEGGNE